MRDEGRLRSRGVALFVLGLVLLNYPLLSALAPDALPLGLPALWVFLYTVWLLLIAALAWIAERAP